MHDSRANSTAFIIRITDDLGDVKGFEQPQERSLNGANLGASSASTTAPLFSLASVDSRRPAASTSQAAGGEHP